jgi:GNAT superfamily N-acetyltransferase
MRMRRGGNGGNAKPAEATANGGEVIIRPLAPRDRAAIVALDARNTGMAKPEYWNAIFAGRGRRGDPRYILVAEHRRAVVGFVVGEVRAWEFGSPPCGWVFAIHVDPDSRLRKIGTRLLDAITGEFRAAGVTKLRTMLARTDMLNLRFFRAQGMMAGPFIQLEKELA